MAVPESSTCTCEWVPTRQVCLFFFFKFSKKYIYFNFTFLGQFFPLQCTTSINGFLDTNNVYLDTGE